MKGSQGRRAPEKGAGLGGFARRASGLLIPERAKIHETPQHERRVERKSGIVAVKFRQPNTKDNPKTKRRKKEKARRASRAKNRK